MAMLRKANSLSVIIYRLIKKRVMYQGEKLIQTLVFFPSYLSSAYEVLTRRNIM